MLEQNMFQSIKICAVSSRLLTCLSDAEPFLPPRHSVCRPASALCLPLFSATWIRLYPLGPVKFPSWNTSQLTGRFPQLTPAAPASHPIEVTQHILLYNDIHESVLQVGNSPRAGTTSFSHWFIHPFAQQILIEHPLPGGPCVGCWDLHRKPGLKSGS